MQKHGKSSVEHLNKRGKHLGKYGNFLVICLKEHEKYIVKVEGKIREILRETCFFERKTQITNRKSQIANRKSQTHNIYLGLHIRTYWQKTYIQV